MRTTVLACIMLGLVACAQPQSEFFTVVKRPSEWSAEQMQVISESLTGQICFSYNRGTAGTGAYSQEDFRILEQELRRRGFSARDIELLQRRGRAFGTGQSWAALQCSVPGVQIVNRSFYPGLGHTWQARTPGGQFVYLRGDGNERNMRVHSWN